ncbi:MAG: YDG domain-containing protein, partial [Cyclobacteriaceae bacterium]|nr:YDG domain-containing protein [Cyclobacteriaceae bacterium]
MGKILLKSIQALFLGTLLLLVGGWSTALGQATVTTDKDDYSPGMYVVITGSGWQPGETVTLHIDEDPKPTTCMLPHNMSAVADENGNIFNNQMLIKENHLGVTFTLTATGQSSGLTATRVFTDAGLSNVSVVGTSFCAGQTVTVNFETVSANIGFGGGQFTATADFYAELSNSNGSFSNPVIIGSLMNTAGSGNRTIIAQIPVNIPSGTGYRIRVRSEEPATNEPINPVNLTINAATTVTNPTNFTNEYGLDATFSVTGSGSGSLTYQWEEFNGTWTPISNGGIYSGATTNTLTLTTPGVALSGRRYRVVVTGACGSATSDGNATLTITPKPLTGAFTADNKVYDGTTSATVLGRSLNGVLAGDVGNVSLIGGTATFGDKNVANGKTVTLTGATLSGSAAGNYNLTSVGTTTANITPKSASVTADAQSKTYGDVDPTLTGTLSGFLAEDNVQASYSRTTGEIVAGSPYTISATLSPAGVLGNYDITYNTAELSITERAIEVTADDKSKVYGEADPGLTYQITSGSLAFSDAFSGALSR